MNQEDHKLRRRLGALAVLSAAAGAASAAALITAALAFADPVDDAVAALSTTGSSPLDTALQADGASSLLQTDETTFFSNPDLAGAENIFIDALNAKTPFDTTIIEGLNVVVAHGDSTLAIAGGDAVIDIAALLSGVVG
jgi:hypothetical protein